MKKQNIVNLVKYHMQKDDASFNNEVYLIAQEFDRSGDLAISQYLLSLIRNTDTLRAQELDYSHFNYLIKDNRKPISISFPDKIANDILSISKTINKKNGLHRFLFVGKPGTGKTEACRHIARLTNRALLIVNMEDLIDSHLGQTPKNIVALFNEINKVIFDNVIILFDEIDSIVMDRINDNDLREMGRATSSFLKQFDNLDDEVVIIGTTNLFKMLDGALVRRFDATISFDRYSLEDLCGIADSFFHDFAHDSENIKYDAKVTHKIIKLSNPVPSPSELKNIIRFAISFGDNGKYDYLRVMFEKLCPSLSIDNIDFLKLSGFTLDDLEKLTSISKSTLFRMLNKGNN